MDLDKYLKGVKKILTEDINEIYIEGQEDLSRNILNYIEDSLSIKVFNGEDIKIKYLPIILKKAYRILKENLEEKEVLILDDNIDRIKKTIEEISNYVGYITVVGLKEEEQNHLYDYILEETGISIFYPLNIEKIAVNYSIVINFMDNVDHIFNKLRRYVLVFDFSQEKHKDFKNRPPLIRDLFFILNSSEGENCNFISTKVSSSLFSALSISQYKDDVLLYAEGKCYSIRNYVDNFIKFIGRF